MPSVVLLEVQALPMDQPFHPQLMLVLAPKVECERYTNRPFRRRRGGYMTIRSASRWRASIAAWQMRMPTEEHTKYQSFLLFFQVIAPLILASCNPICNYVISYTLPR